MLLINPVLWTCLTMGVSAGLLAEPREPQPVGDAPAAPRTLEAFVRADLLAARDPDEGDRWREEAERWRDQAEKWERKARDGERRLSELEQKLQQAERDEQAERIALEERLIDVRARIDDLHTRLAELDEGDREWHACQLKLEVLGDEASKLEHLLHEQGAQHDQQLEDQLHKLMQLRKDLAARVYVDPPENEREKQALYRRLQEVEQGIAEHKRMLEASNHGQQQEEHYRRLEFERQEIEMMHQRLEFVVGWEEVAFQPERALVMAVQSIVELCPEPEHAVKVLEHLLDRLPEEPELAGPRSVVRFALKEAYLQLDRPDDALEQMMGVVEENAEVLGR